ncbi:hypothetical protein COU57_00315 [Candidatus Pacearchaeota archaeon CG10_big_fil_rev_8_21_14_0_10_32_14]|nr:MAG: hypothetical protein COU57_00315 [Candidatus Pacearchaeota archaeon CG10_big_fil_rev_8_21_14_0_10_32_14]
MELIRDFRYESGLDRNDKISPESVFQMLVEIRREIGKLDTSFEKLSLREILKVVDNNPRYKTKGYDELGIKGVVDVSDARRVISFYRSYSERGCESCTSFKETGDPTQNSKVLSYCNLFEPDPEKVKGETGNDFGFSPTIRKYIFVGGCDSRTPKFSPKIDQLVEFEELAELRISTNTFSNQNLENALV